MCGLVLTSAAAVAASLEGSGDTLTPSLAQNGDADDDDVNGTGTLPNTGTGTTVDAGWDSKSGLLALGEASIATMGTAYAARRRLA